MASVESRSGSESASFRASSSPVIRDTRSYVEETHQKVAGLAKKASESRSIFPVDTMGRGLNLPPLVNHDGRSGMLAVDNLAEAGANPEELARFLDRRGSWNHERLLENPFRMTPENLDRAIKEMLVGLNRLIDRSLDYPQAEGFNRHGEGHSSRVVKVARQLVEEDARLRKKKGFRQEEIVAILAGRFHDIGNLLSRSTHSFVSDRMTRAIVPRIVDNPDLYRQVHQAIVLHPSDSLRKVTTELWTPEKKPTARWKKMRKHLGAGGLAMIMADKVDIGRERISDKADSKTIFKDPHAEVNYWGKNDGVEVSEDGKILVWVVKYTPQINEADIKRYPHFARELQRQQEDSSYKPRFFEEWIDLFLQLYNSRVVTFTDCGFALFPSVEQVSVIFVNEEGYKRSSQVIFDKKEFDIQSKQFLQEYASPMSE